MNVHTNRQMKFMYVLFMWGSLRLPLNSSYVCTYTMDHIKLNEMLLFKVKDVRTNDDTLITVKLMIFYELSDVETMVCIYICTHGYTTFSGFSL